MKLVISDIVKSVEKYHFFMYNKNTKEFIKLHSDNSNKNGLKHIIKDIKKMNRNNILVRVQLKIVSKKDYDKNKKSPIKVLGGPIYGYITEYKYEKNKLSKLQTKLKNKVYFTTNYLNKMKNKNNKWLYSDIMKIGKKYTTNKLDFSLLAINNL